MDETERDQEFENLCDQIVAAKDSVTRWKLRDLLEERFPDVVSRINKANPFWKPIRGQQRKNKNKNGLKHSNDALRREIVAKWSR